MKQDTKAHRDALGLLHKARIIEVTRSLNETEMLAQVRSCLIFTA